MNVECEIVPIQYYWGDNNAQIVGFINAIYEIILVVSNCWNTLLQWSLGLHSVPFSSCIINSSYLDLPLTITSPPFQSRDLISLPSAAHFNIHIYFTSSHISSVVKIIWCQFFEVSDHESSVYNYVITSFVVCICFTVQTSRQILLCTHISRNFVFNF